MSLKLTCSLGVLLLTMACGGKSTTAPTPVTPVAPTLTSLTITGLEAVRSNFFTTYTATAGLSNGTSQDVTSTTTWTSTNPNIGSMTPATPGRLDANAHGTIVITAAYQGRSSTKTVNVVQNFGGQWSGVSIVRACDQSGAFRDIRWCQGYGLVGSQVGFSLGLAQGGTDRSQITGNVNVGSITGPITGTVTADGRLNLGGTYTFTNNGVSVQMTIGGWNTSASAGDRMTGTWSQNLTVPGFSGNAYEQHEIINVTHLTVQARAQERQ